MKIKILLNKIVKYKKTIFIILFVLVGISWFSIRPVLIYSICSKQSIEKSNQKILLTLEPDLEELKQNSNSGSSFAWDWKNKYDEKYKIYEEIKNNKKYLLEDYENYYKVCLRNNGINK